jgi:uncharacterized protein (DUF433 family)
MQLADRIVADADTCSGFPRIAGTRIRVAHILEWLSSGMSEADVLADYEQLTPEDIRAALALAPTSSSRTTSS